MPGYLSILNVKRPKTGKKINGVEHLEIYVIGYIINER